MLADWQRQLRASIPILEKYLAAMEVCRILALKQAEAQIALGQVMRLYANTMSSRSRATLSIPEYYHSHFAILSTAADACKAYGRAYTDLAVATEMSFKDLNDTVRSFFRFLQQAEVKLENSANSFIEEESQIKHQQGYLRVLMRHRNRVDSAIVESAARLYSSYANCFDDSLRRSLNRDSMKDPRYETRDKAAGSFPADRVLPVVRTPCTTNVKDSTSFCLTPEGERARTSYTRSLNSVTSNSIETLHCLSQGTSLKDQLDSLASRMRHQRSRQHVETEIWKDGHRPGAQIPPATVHATSESGIELQDDIMMALRPSVNSGHGPCDHNSYITDASSVHSSSISSLSSFAEPIVPHHTVIFRQGDVIDPLAAHNWNFSTTLHPSGSVKSKRSTKKGLKSILGSFRKFKRTNASSVPSQG